MATEDYFLVLDPLSDHIRGGTIRRNAAAFIYYEYVFDLERGLCSGFKCTPHESRACGSGINILRPNRTGGRAR